MAKPRVKNKDNARRSKKKSSILTIDKIDYVDYKDVNLLKRFISDRAKVRARRVTGNDAQQQAEIARAIKNAREMALIPYSNRITQQRSNRSDRDRGRSSSEPPPTPSAPPPGAPSGAPTDEMDDMGDDFDPTESAMTDDPAADDPATDDVAEYDPVTEEA